MVFKKYIFIFVILFIGVEAGAQTRQDILLNNNWLSVASDSNEQAFDGFEKASYPTKNWQQVTVPHNWDAYEGYRRKLHGNRHGTAWYRRSFQLVKKETGKRYFLFFEGVGSYATVWLNGKQVGNHAGGRTTFTIDITNDVLAGNRQNVLAVKAGHPSFIKDLPWVCGGCSDERGFSEGSQPMGIFRPVHFITTNDVRIVPFGIHAWNDTTVSEKAAVVQVVNTVTNDGAVSRNLTVINRLLNKQNKNVAEIKTTRKLAAGETVDLKQTFPEIKPVQLWSLVNPYLYTIETTVSENGKVLDQQTIPYGIRWISWPIKKPKSSNQFYLNGKPVFINGTAEYEHLIGQSHAFSPEQIRARISQVKASGFNAFRDAHQPHNLLYQQLIDSTGMLWWTQFSAHVWYDSPLFRQNFKTLLKEWVVERRNSPSLVLWGLQNESKIPEDFAKECSELIRSLDPTASSQRLITTCNGGSGTDWDVPQNWTGTYGGDPATYAADVKRQILIGEYGAWRTLSLHTEGPFVTNGPLSEDRMTLLMEQKVRLAESVKDSSCGQFFWLHTSHDNPGRVQGGEGFRELDRIGPVNYKGLLTPWEEPTDAFYMFRSNYAPKETEPMVYIVSHTWPDRWTQPGIKDSIIVYSNCDEVELFNDVDSISLGKRKRSGVGTHFQWDDITIQYNVLKAKGFVNGKQVAEDVIVLHHLPKAPGFDKLFAQRKGEKEKARIGIGNQQSQTGASPLREERGMRGEALLRINCGGPQYIDKNGNVWQADIAKNSDSTWGSISWTNRFADMPPYFASQRIISDPVNETLDWPLFQSFRYGRHELKYQFPVPDGKYIIELYFTEPWWGTGGVNATGYRIFDVAINNKTVIKNLDLFKEAGCRTAIKKAIEADVKGGVLTISFPNVAAGQAVISAIAVFPENKITKPVPASSSIISNLFYLPKSSEKLPLLQSWLNTGDTCFANERTTFSYLPPELYGAEWIRFNRSSADGSLYAFSVTKDADVFIALDQNIEKLPDWIVGGDTALLAGLTDKVEKAKWVRNAKGYEFTHSFLQNDENGKHNFNIYRKRFLKGDMVRLGTKGKSKNGEDIRMYFVAVQPASNLEPAYDLKPTTSYRPATAVINNAVKDSVNGRESINLTAETSSVEWPITTGVADIYSLTVRYANSTGKKVNGTLTLLAADGTQMIQEKIEFTPSPKGKWNYIATNTGTQINAGNYWVRITGAGVSVSGLDVQ